MNVQDSGGLIYLMACGLNGRRPEEAALAGLDLGKLYRQARRHSVTALVAMTLEQTRAFGQGDPALQEKFRGEKNRAIRRAVLMEAEGRAVSEALEERGIWHMALKGSLLKDWYPKYGMREMADVDLLIDPGKRETVRDLFLSRGYEVELYEEDIHDVYRKKPVYNFEVHRALFQRAYPRLAAYYENIRERLLPVEGRCFALRFTPEDFYVYFQAHAYKHYCLGGTGLRTLADQYVLDRRLGGTMEQSRVDRELDRLGLLTYARESRSLAEKLFGSPEPFRAESLTEAERRTVDYYLGSGTYGTEDNVMRNRLQALQGGRDPVTGATKVRYVLGRLFPGRQSLKEAYPLVYWVPVLLPLYWLWRLVVKGLFRWKENCREWSRMKKS